MTCKNRRLLLSQLLNRFKEAISKENTIKYSKNTIFFNGDIYNHENTSLLNSNETQNNEKNANKLELSNNLIHDKQNNNDLNKKHNQILEWLFISIHHNLENYSLENNLGLNKNLQLDLNRSMPIKLFTSKPSIFQSKIFTSKDLESLDLFKINNIQKAYYSKKFTPRNEFRNERYSSHKNSSQNNNPLPKGNESRFRNKISDQFKSKSVHSSEKKKLMTSSQNLNEKKLKFRRFNNSAEVKEEIGVTKRASIDSFSNKKRPSIEENSNEEAIATDSTSLSTPDLSIESKTQSNSNESRKIFSKSNNIKKKNNNIEKEISFLGTPPEIRFLHPHVLELHEKVKYFAINGDTNEVMKLFTQLENEPGYDSENDYILSMIMLAYIQSGKISNALQVFRQYYILESLGFLTGKKRVKIVLPLNILMQAYGALKDIPTVLKIFKCIEDEGLYPDINSCLAVTKVFLNCDDMENALKCIQEWFSSSLFPETLKDDRKVMINDTVYRELAHKFIQLGTFAEKDNLEMIIEAAKQDLNDTGFIKLCNNILHNYSSLGRDSEMEEAFENLFFSTLNEKTKKNTLKPNLSTFQTLIAHFSQKRNINKVKKYLNIHLVDFPDISPSQTYLKIVMRCLGDSKEYDLLKAVFNEFFVANDEESSQIHLSKLEATTDEYNIMIRSLATNGEVDRIQTLIKEMKRNNISLTPTTHVYVMLGHIKAGNLRKFLKLFKLRMATQDSEDFIHPDLESFLFLLQAIGGSGQLRIIVPIFETMARFGIPLDAVVHNRVLRGLSDYSTELLFQYFLTHFKESPYLNSLGYIKQSNTSYIEDALKLPSRGLESSNLNSNRISNPALQINSSSQQTQDSHQTHDLIHQLDESELFIESNANLELILHPTIPNTQTYSHVMLNYALAGDTVMCQHLLKAFLLDGFVKGQVDREHLYNRLIASYIINKKYQEAYFLWKLFFEMKDTMYLLPDSDAIQNTLSMIMKDPSTSWMQWQKAPKAIPNATSFSYLQFIFKALHRPQYEKAIELYRRKESMNRILKDDYLLFEKFN